MYEYRAVILKVVDGDTVDADIDVGLQAHVHARLRLNGINTPESAGKDACPEGVQAKEYLKTLFPLGTPVIVKTEKDKTEKYGRWLATIFLTDQKGNPVGVSVNQQLIDKGMAKPWGGQGIRPV